MFVLLLKLVDRFLRNHQRFSVTRLDPVFVWILWVPPDTVMSVSLEKQSPDKFLRISRPQNSYRSVSTTGEVNEFPRVRDNAILAPQLLYNVLLPLI